MQKKHHSIESLKRLMDQLVFNNEKLLEKLEPYQTPTRNRPLSPSNPRSYNYNDSTLIQQLKEAEEYILNLKQRVK